MLSCLHSKASSAFNKSDLNRVSRNLICTCTSKKFQSIYQSILVDRCESYILCLDIDYCSPLTALKSPKIRSIDIPHSTGPLTDERILARVLAPFPLVYNQP